MKVIPDNNVGGLPAYVVDSSDKEQIADCIELDVEPDLSQLRFTLNPPAGGPVPGKRENLLNILSFAKRSP